MTQESKELITKICKERLWEKYDDPLSIVDEEVREEMKRLESESIGDPDSFIIYRCPKDTASTKCISFVFETKEEAEKYYKGILDTQIEFECVLAIGSYDELVTENMFHSTLLFGRYVFTEFDRMCAKRVFDHNFGLSVNKDFLTWVNSDNGKHWNEIEKTPTIFEELFGSDSEKEKTE